MIYFELFLGFLEVGCLAFGGAYGSIPLIRDLVIAKAWLNEELLTYMIAVSESTPGPIMINIATFIGSSQAGLLGAIIATIAVIIPPFVLIILITASLKTALKNDYVQAALRGLKPCVAGIVLATGLYMVIKNGFYQGGAVSFNQQSSVLTIFLIVTLLGYGQFFKKKLAAIPLIIIAAIAGVIFYGL